MPPGASAAASDAPGAAVPRLLCLAAAAAAGGGRRRCGGHAAAGVLSVMRSLVFRRPLWHCATAPRRRAQDGGMPRLVRRS